MKYSIKFYEDKTGYSELYEELMVLASKVSTNKDAKIQFYKITYYIELLQNLGTALPTNVSKHITGEIWELRPANNRILYFYFKDNTFVLLHMFRKTTQKTPKSEIEKAKRECADYKNRLGGSK